MPIDLYYISLSPPCRSVMLVAKALGIELNLKQVDMQKKEHLSPEYLKLNPQHTIPTIVDDGFALGESRAIITYLVNKYGKGSPLYPEDPKARAVVDQRLYFDIGTLYQRFADYTFPQLLAGAPADEAKFKKIEEALEVLETFLEGSKFVAGPNLTVADLSIVVSVSGLPSIKIDIFKYPKIKAWYELMVKTTPGYKEINEVGKAALEGFINSMLKK